MKLLSVAASAVLVAGVGVFVATPASAATLDVCPTGCTYSSIKTAVTAANSGDTINVAAGTYSESLITITKPVTINGAGEGATNVDGGNLGKQIFDIRPGAATGSGPVAITGMTLTNAGAAVYDISVNIGVPTTGISTIDFDHIAIDGSGGTVYGIYAFGGYKAATPVDRVAPALTLTNSLISGQRANGLSLDGYRGAATIERNTFVEGTGGSSAVVVFNEYTPNRMTDPVIITNNTSTGRFVSVRNDVSACAIRNVSPCSKTADSFGGFDDVRITDNTVKGLSANDFAIKIGSNAFAGGPVTSINNAVVTGNRVIGGGPSVAGTSGVLIQGAAKGITVNENDLSGLENGVRAIVDGSDNPSSVTVERNRLFADTNGVSNSTTANINATENWWGCQDGPRSPSTFCSKVTNTGTGTVDTSTWIRARATLSAATVETGKTLTVTGALDTLAPANTTVSPLPVPPLQGQPVGFSATRGSVTPTPVPLNAALTASSTYTAPATSGADAVTVVPDSETIGLTPVTGEPITLSLNVTLPPATGGGGSGPVASDVNRYSGGNRYSTSVDISKNVFKDGAGVVYVASGLGYADGLTGGPSAAKDDGPLLLTGTSSVPAGVIAEIERLKPRSIIVLGGPVAVDANVVARLGKIAKVIRLGGQNRFGTAAAVAKHNWTTSSTVYLASGLNFPDALSGGAFAAGRRAPLLLTATTSVPTETLDALKRLKPSKVVIIGGPVVVSDAIKSAIRTAVPGIAFERIAGRDRYETSAAALKASGAHNGQLMLANGTTFADALSGGPAAAHLGSGFALSQQACLSTAVGAVADAQKIDRYYLLGGSAVLSGNVVTQRCD